MVRGKKQRNITEERAHELNEKEERRLLRWLLRKMSALISRQKEEINATFYSDENYRSTS